MHETRTTSAAVAVTWNAADGGIRATDLRRGRQFGRTDDQGLGLWSMRNTRETEPPALA